MDQERAQVADKGLQAEQEHKGWAAPGVEDEREDQKNGIARLDGGGKQVDSIAQHQEGEDEEQAGKDHI